MGDPVIAGYGLVKISEHWDKDIISLAYDAVRNALNGVSKGDIDGIIVGNAYASSLDIQASISIHLADELGLNNIYLSDVNMHGVSSAIALIEGYRLIQSGDAEIVLAGGVEKLSDSMPNEIYHAELIYGDPFISRYTGLTEAGINGIAARLYMERYKIDREKISYLAVLDHENSIRATHAQFNRAIDIEMVLSSPIIADPLTVFDSYPIGDGACFILLADRDKALDLGLKTIDILGYGFASNYASLSHRPDVLSLDATRRATNIALKNASIGLSQIDLAEIFDQYTITGLLSLEAIGFSSRGGAAENVWAGFYNIGGPLPINTFGGLKARGNPIGATSAYQVAEIYMRLTDGGDEFKDAKIGLVHSMAGFDYYSTVFILGGG